MKVVIKNLQTVYYKKGVTKHDCETSLLAFLAGIFVDGKFTGVLYKGIDTKGKTLYHSAKVVRGFDIEENGQKVRYKGVRATNGKTYFGVSL